MNLNPQIVYRFRAGQPDPGRRCPVVRLLKQQRPELYAQWQQHLREMCLELFAGGYSIVAFIRGSKPVNYYVLEPDVRLVPILS